jgi:hypothetical protein
VVHDGHDDTLAAVRRSARDLLIVGDGLYTAGGTPFLVKNSEVYVVSTRADRSVPAPFGGLRVQPAGGQQQPAHDWAACHRLVAALLERGAEDVAASCLPMWPTQAAPLTAPAAGFVLGLRHAGGSCIVPALVPAASPRPRKRP